MEAIRISIVQVKIQRLREGESLFQNNPAVKIGSLQLLNNSVFLAFLRPLLVLHICSSAISSRWQVCCLFLIVVQTLSPLNHVYRNGFLDKLAYCGLASTSLFCTQQLNLCNRLSLISFISNFFTISYSLHCHFLLESLLSGYKLSYCSFAISFLVILLLILLYCILTWVYSSVFLFFLSSNFWANLSKIYVFNLKFHPVHPTIYLAVLLLWGSNRTYFLSLVYVPISSSLLLFMPLQLYWPHRTQIMES